MGSLILNGSLGLSNTGITNITGVIAGTIYADTINLIPTFSTSMSFNFQNSQCYYITPTGAITGVTITNLPTTPLKTYVFTFILNTTSKSNLITASNITINSTKCSGVLFYRWNIHHKFICSNFLYFKYIINNNPFVEDFIIM